ncbi:MAG: amidohydrolase family protein [Pseudomonadota bacterium]
MNDMFGGARSSDIKVQDVRVPRSVVADAARFGGLDEGAYVYGDLVIAHGEKPRLYPPSRTGPPCLVLPRFAEPHVHLDKCHSVDRMPAVGGDLRAAITSQAKDRERWTWQDLRARGTRGLSELAAAGCAVVRSHVDWPYGVEARTPPISWHVLKEIAQDHAGDLRLQLAPLTTLADLADPVTAKVLGKEIADAKGALGSFVLDHPHRKAGIRNAFDIAMRHSLALDFHVDEGLSPGLNGLDIIAQTAIETGFEGPILCGHACSLINKTGDNLARTMDLVARAGITIVTMPTTNLYLQSRTDGTPDRRGLTRVRELCASGVPVIVGTDNVRDAFCPLGRHDPRTSLALAVLAAHLDPPLADLWPMITTDARNALGMDPVYVDTAHADELVICAASSSTEALSGAATLTPLGTYASGKQP